METNSLLNKINQQSNKEQTERAQKFKALGAAFADAWVGLNNRKTDVEDICRVAYAYLQLKRQPIVLPYTDRNKIVAMDLNSRPANDPYMSPSNRELIPISFVAKGETVLYYPDGSIYIAKTGFASIHNADVTTQIKEIRDTLNSGENGVIARVDDNHWVHASVIAEGISTIFKSLDALSEFLTQTVADIDKEPEKEPENEDVFEWGTYKYPRLTDEERSRVDQFVHKTAPNSDSIAQIFNLLIRFARETIDDSRRKKP